MADLDLIAKMTSQLDFKRREFPMSTVSPVITLFQETQTEMRIVEKRILQSKLKTVSKVKLLNKWRMESNDLLLQIKEVIDMHNRITFRLMELMECVTLCIYKVCQDKSVIAQLNRSGILKSLSQKRTVQVVTLVSEGSLMLNIRDLTFEADFSSLTGDLAGKSRNSTGKSSKMASGEMTETSDSSEREISHQNISELIAKRYCRYYFPGCANDD